MVGNEYNFCLVLLLERWRYGYPCSHRMDAHSHSFFAANLSVAVGVIFRTLAESFLLPIVCKAFVQLDAATSVVTGCHFGALLASIFASKL